MRDYITCIGILCFLGVVEGKEEDMDLSPISFFLSTPKEGLNQLDFSGKPFVKKEKQVSFLYKNMIKHGHVQDPDLVWDWGLRTGIGWNTVIKNWNLIATYTKFHTKPFAGMTTPEGLVMPTWKNASLKKNEPPEAGNFVAWRLHLDLADVELGRSFTPVEKVSLRPHVGVRAAWIYQKRKRVQADKDEVSQRNQPLFCSNNCIGLGGRGGVDSLWNVGKGVSLFGDGALSLLAGYYNIDQRKRPIQTDYQMSDEENGITNGIATAEISLGMQYEKALSIRKFFTVRVGYEVNYIFNQTRWMDWFSNAKGALADAGSGMSLQGVTLGFRLDF
ncbi:MAG: Lpg1974 family pore-forming outer membrane protein [Chlamydiota bacterium]